MNEAIEGTRERDSVLQDISVTPSRTLASESNGLRVAHLSPRDGGTAIAAKRLHGALLNIGAESRLFVTPAPVPNEPMPHVYPVQSVGAALAYADRVSGFIEQHLNLTGLTHVSSLFWSFAGFDIVHFHGMDGSWFNLQSLRRLNKRHALVWTMHDLHLCTGACGIPEVWGNCERWRTGCGQCPKARALSWPLDPTRFVFAHKQRLIPSTDMTLIAPSQLIRRMVESSPMTQHQIGRWIPHGIETETFAPQHREACRLSLGLPKQATLLLMVATSHRAPQKGPHYYAPLLREIRVRCPERDMALVVVGSAPHQETLAAMREVMPVYLLGTIGVEHLLAKVYSACDLFITTSIFESFCNVVLESLACGTPVAAFEVGGIPDMVKPGVTGVLAPAGDTVRLGSEIGALLLADTLVPMRKRCRESVLQNFTCDLQAKRHLALYRELIDSRLPQHSR